MIRQHPISERSQYRSEHGSDGEPDQNADLWDSAFAKFSICIESFRQILEDASTNTPEPPVAMVAPSAITSGIKSDSMATNCDADDWERLGRIHQLTKWATTRYLVSSLGPISRLQ